MGRLTGRARNRGLIPQGAASGSTYLKARLGTFHSASVRALAYPQRRRIAGGRGARRYSGFSCRRALRALRWTIAAARLR